MYKGIISKTKKIRRKQTITTHLLFLSRRGEKLYSSVRLPEKFNNAQLVGFAKGIVYLGIAKAPYYYLYAARMSQLN